MSEDVQVDVLALQETHLTSVTLQRMRVAAFDLSLAAPPCPTCTTCLGVVPRQACVVGFLTPSDVTVQFVPPAEAAGRFLHAVCRLHTILRPGHAGCTSSLCTSR